MTTRDANAACRRRCWTMAATAGVVAAVVFSALLGWGLIGSLFAGLVVFIIVGAVLVWNGCAEEPATYEAPASVAPQPAPPSHEPVTKALEPEDEPVDAEPVEETSAEPVEEPQAPLIKPSTALFGEAELAARKGSWRYEPPVPAAEPAAKEKLQALLDTGGLEDPTDPDNDGTAVEAPETIQPQAMDAPRDGAADNLKKIKGVGPKLEKLLHSLGFFHFDQIAAWNANEVAWVDANLEGFKGRVTRDNWVAQAQELAANGKDGDA